MLVRGILPVRRAHRRPHIYWQSEQAMWGCAVQLVCCVTRRRPNNPGTTHPGTKQRSTQQRTSACSYAGPTKRSQPSLRQTYATDSIILHTAKPRLKQGNTRMTHLYRDAPACHRSSVGQPPGTCTHKPSQPTDSELRYDAGKPPMSGQLARAARGASTSRPSRIKFKC